MWGWCSCQLSCLCLALWRAFPTVFFKYRIKTMLSFSFALTGAFMCEQWLLSICCPVLQPCAKLGAFWEQPSWHHLWLLGASEGTTHFGIHYLSVLCLHKWEKYLSPLGGSGTMENSPQGKGTPDSLSVTGQLWILTFPQQPRAVHELLLWETPSRQHSWAEGRAGKKNLTQRDSFFNEGLWEYISIHRYETNEIHVLKEEKDLH